MSIECDLIKPAAKYEQISWILKYYKSFWFGETLDLTTVSHAFQVEERTACTICLKRINYLIDSAILIKSSLQVVCKAS